ncbi:MAG: hypothetical protein QXP29_05860 [Candidatus Nezhaarchaeales archaeon]
MRKSQTAGSLKLVISIDNAETYKDLIVVWFAEATTKIMQNALLKNIDQQQLTHIANMASSSVNIKTDPSDFILLTSNDRKKINSLTLSTSIQTLQNPQQAQGVESLPPAFSLEYLEHIRKFFPQAKNKFQKRQIIYVKKDLLALAVLGAYFTHYYKEFKDNTVCYYYILADTLQLGAIRLHDLNNEARRMSRVLREADASPITLYVGLASLYANKIRQLEEGSAILTHVIISGTRSRGGKYVNRPTLLSFDQRDLTNLARDIRSLGWGFAIEKLVMNYPVIQSNDPEDVKRCKRVVKSFIESLTRAVYVWHSLGDMQEIYRILRTLTSEEFNMKAHEYFKYKRSNWATIRNQLINVRI